jgi:hypothetical protein
VLGARDRRTYTGAEPAVVQHRSSEVIVECGSRGASLFDEPDLTKQVKASRKREPEKHEHASAKPASTAPKPACTPGVSQACVGVGGCAGGQACLDDGSGFAPCQCAPASEPASEEAPPSDENAGDQAPADTRESGPDAAAK